MLTSRYREILSKRKPDFTVVLLWTQYTCFEKIHTQIEDFVFVFKVFEKQINVAQIFKIREKS